MTPFWIVNFLEKGSIEPFFETYWKAYLQNNREANEGDKFFYITDATDTLLTKEKLQETASQRLSRDTSNEPKLIPAFKSNNDNEINVIFIGDITSEKTIKDFHNWAAYLMSQRMRGSEAAWYSISKVTFYGILMRPDSSTVDDNVVTKEIKGFLNELQTMEQMNVNYRPFQHILFLQSSENKEKHTAAEEALCIAAYHIARTNGACFEQNSNYCFHDINATGVFYEADVQKELDAFNLSQVIISDFTANAGPEFLDIKEAEKFVNDNGDFINRVTPKGISEYITSDCNCPDEVRIKRPVHPLNLLRIGKVWHEYYGKYIKGMKRELVNKIRRNLMSFEDNYRKQLSQHQIEFITENTNALQELVFQMFCDTGNRERFRHISLPQSLKVLELFEDKIRNNFSDNTGKADAFIIPEDLLKAAQKAQMNNWTSNHVLDVLTDKLQTLPLYNFARLIRVLLCGTLFGGLLNSLCGPLSWIAIPIILAIDLIVFSFRVKRIEALKDQYTGMKLIEMRTLMDNQVNLMIEKTKDEMSQYIIYLREKKLEWLQKSLSVISAPSFQFKVSDVFQPLVNVSSTKTSETKLLIPSKKTRANSIADLSGQSGSFGKYPLTSNISCAQIIDQNGQPCSISDITNNKKNTVQFLIQELMREHERVVDGTEETINFKTHDIKNRSMLLLLDVSGSMAGQPLEELRKYVMLLTSRGSIEWIAFSDNVCLTSRSNNADDLKAVNGTNYIPAINKALEWIKEGANYDDIILISDGYPFESANDIINASKHLNQPLNTVAIGDTAETILVDIALQTGGEEITIDSFENLSEKWDNEIMPRITAIDDGDYSFGDLLKRCQIVPAARALRAFALKQLDSSNITIPKLIGQYGDNNGLKEWISVTSQRNTLNIGSAKHQESVLFATAYTAGTDDMKRKLESIGATRIDVSKDEPDMIVSMLTEQPLDKIGDLQWAPTFSHDDKSANDTEMLRKMAEEHRIKAVNIYNNEL